MAGIEATVDAATTAGPRPARYRIIRRLMTYLTPFNGTMFISLVARVVRILCQAALLGIAAAAHPIAPPSRCRQLGRHLAARCAG